MFAALTIREVAVCAIAAFTDEHIKAKAQMLRAVLIDRVFIFSSSFFSSGIGAGEVATGIRPVAKHTYTAAATTTMSGIDLVTLAAMLGHSGIQMVLRYAHPPEQHQADAAPT
jgi:hypothetical protein